MQGPFIDNTEGSCPHSYWKPGYPIPRDNSYPERAWGAYLPGDGPGWDCSLHSNGCPGEVFWLSCPRIERAGKFCPICFEEGHVVRLYKDPDGVGVPHWCSECDNYWPDVMDLRAEWQKTTQMFNELKEAENVK